MSTSHKAESACVTEVVVVLVVTLVVVVLSTLGTAYSTAEKDAKAIVRMRRTARTTFGPFTALEGAAGVGLKPLRPFQEQTSASERKTSTKNLPSPKETSCTCCIS